MADLEGLKRVLRSLVVSTPTTMDASTLLRDYRRMVGEALPAARYGYRDPVLFLREQCADSFLFQGPQSNPILTLIVNKAIKHIDQYVQSQKMPSKQIRGKRRSVPESTVRNTGPQRWPANSISWNTCAPKKPEPVLTQPVARPESSRPLARPESSRPIDRPVSPRPVTKDVPKPVRSDSVGDLSSKMEGLSNGRQEQKGTNTRLRLQSFLEAYKSQQLSRRSTESLKNTDDDSGRQTSSSCSSRSAAALAQLKDELTRLVAQHPGPVWCSQLLRLYEAAYGRELNFSRFGFPSVSACACAVEGLAATRAADGDWLLAPRDAAGAGAAPAGAAAVLRVRRPRPHQHQHQQHDSRAGLAPLDADDALPGIDYEPDVFPADCLSFLESIPAGSVADVAPGQMLAVVVGEVYSPSHLWVLRLGPDMDTMEEYMDEMTEYYSKGDGKERVLAAGARRPGQYCSSVFEGDWHRSLIVQVLDSDTVKVLHVDYGTVDTVAASSLRPLRRQWAGLPAQAVRALLAGLRPAAASRRWPRAAAAHCLALVRERRLVANVVAVDREENILELFLIDTSTDEDVNVTDQMIRAGHADRRPLPALGVSVPQAASDTSDTSHTSHTSDEWLDVRSLASCVLRAPRDDASDVSASASEVLGRAPRRLALWECPEPAADAAADADTATGSPDRSVTRETSSRLKKLRAKASICRGEDASVVSASVVSPSEALSAGSARLRRLRAQAAARRTASAASARAPDTRAGTRDVEAGSVVSASVISPSDVSAPDARRPAPSQLSRLRARACARRQQGGG